MNKRGFIRTLEAVLAIIIVFVFIYVVSQNDFLRSDSSIDSIRSLQEEVLRGISENEVYREEVLTCPYLNDDLKQKETELPFVKYVGDNLGRFSDRYALIVCETTNCGIPDLPDKNVYTSAIVVTGSLPSTYSPKIVRLWVW